MNDSTYLFLSLIEQPPENNLTLCCVTLELDHRYNIYDRTSLCIEERKERISREPTGMN